jgi:RNA polymerase sigma factor (sigma-70 family)
LKQTKGGIVLGKNFYFNEEIRKLRDELCMYPILTEDEKANLNSLPRDRLLESNYKLAFKLAQKYYENMPHHGSQIEPTDLLNDAIIGLVNAVNKFCKGEYDSQKGSFSTYCFNYIDYAIKDAMPKYSPMPQEKEFFWKVIKATKAYSELLAENKEISCEAIIELLDNDISIEEVRCLLCYIQEVGVTPISLNALVNDERNVITLADVIPDDRPITIEEEEDEREASDSRINGILDFMLFTLCNGPRNKVSALLLFPWTNDAIHEHRSPIKINKDVSANFTLKQGCDLFIAKHREKGFTCDFYPVVLFLDNLITDGKHKQSLFADPAKAIGEAKSRIISDQARQIKNAFWEYISGKKSPTKRKGKNDGTFNR